MRKAQEVSIDVGLCSTMLGSGKALEEVFFEGVTDGMLFDDGKKAFAFIRTFFLKYGKSPDVKTIEEEVGITVPKKVGEPLKYYIDAVKDRALGNLLSGRFKGIVKDLSDGKPGKVVDDLKDLMQEVNRGLLAGGDRVLDITQNIEERKKRYEYIKNVAGGVDGIYTPWATITDITQGWHRGELVTVVARLGVGKTWALLIIAKAAWEQDERVLFVSMEMPTFQIERRFDSLIGSFPYQDFKRGRLGDQVQEKYFEMLDELPKRSGFYVIGGENISSITDIELLIEQYSPTMVLVDGVYLIRPKGFKGSTWERVSDLIIDAKRMAKRKKISVIVSSQFNRRVKTNTTKGTVENIGYADAIPQSSDIVLAMFQDEGKKEDKQMTIKMLKNREDELAEVSVQWDFEEMNFGEIGGTNYAPPAGGGGQSDTGIWEDDGSAKGGAVEEGDELPF